MICYECKTFVVSKNDLECDRGFYGYDCNQTCGHCRDVSHCFPSNGNCLTGCDFGYEGD